MILTRLESAVPAVVLFLLLAPTYWKSWIASCAKSVEASVLY